MVVDGGSKEEVTAARAGDWTAEQRRRSGACVNGEQRAATTAIGDGAVAGGGATSMGAEVVPTTVRRKGHQGRR
ncbi:UNVERIFIED_CONTAM: hypothetical protein Sradi_4431400 [Sesamum radiatum]|uniref:Uncharacterized protein n=1 Tax=Sesamum radiatum TaxID=300843 RepID=A0AAW2NU42_SESRA